MAIKIMYEVIELYDDDDAPEPFGYEALDHVPKAEEIIQLHWLDGSEAYKVSVVSIHRWKPQIIVRLHHEDHHCNAG